MNCMACCASAVLGAVLALGLAAAAPPPGEPNCCRSVSSSCSLPVFRNSRIYAYVQQ